MELRKDYILNRWVIISENRSKRPNNFAETEESKRISCLFCSGNENQTAPEICRFEKNEKWQIRIIENKYSAVDPKGDPIVRTDNKYYTFAGDHGHHEVVIETPDHGKKFGDIPISEVADVLRIYSQRIEKLENADKEDKYICIFKNQGKEAGASIDHAHSQIIALSMIPPEVRDKLDIIERFVECPYCDIIAKEKDSLRRCFENDSFISFTPYASRFNYEIWIFPKRHVARFNDFDDKMYQDLSSMIKVIAQKLEKENIDYDIAWYYSPSQKNMHFHVEIMPRIAKWAGFEMGFGITINTVSPESAAKFYRGEI